MKTVKSTSVLLINFTAVLARDQSEYLAKSTNQPVVITVLKKVIIDSRFITDAVAGYMLLSAVLQFSLLTAACLFEVRWSKTFSSLQLC